MKISFDHNQKKKISGNSAGLAIHDNYLYFIELDGENQPLKKVRVPLPEGCIVNNSIKNFDMLKTGIEEIRRQTGRIREPVSIGLPSGDAVIRLLSFPRMSLDDVRSTLDLSFEEHFNFLRMDAVFDVINVKTPNDNLGRDDVTVLAAAAKIAVIEKFLDIAREAGLPAGSIEPINFAILRAIPEARTGLSIFAEPNAITTIYEGNGIFFSSANNTKGIQDILNTMQYINMTYRTVRIERIILTDLSFQLSANDSMQIVDITDPYVAAIGCANHNLSGFSALDLRPAEYVEREKRRYSFNANRLIFWGLLSSFLLLSIATIFFAITRINYLRLEIDYMRSNVNDLTRRRIELTEANAKLERQKNKTEKILEFLKTDIPVLEIMNALEANSGTGVKFDTATYSRVLTGGFSVVIDGKAADDKSILQMTEGLKQNGMFKSVMLPVSQKAQTQQIIFKLVLTVRDI